MRTSPPVSQINHTYHTYTGRVIFIALLFCILLYGTAQAAPDSFVLGRPGLDVADGKLALSLPLSVDDEDALGDLLLDGASIELLAKVTVIRKRSLWFNEKISEQEFRSLMKHDPLTREFRMNIPGSEQLAQDKNLRSLLARSWKTMRLTLADADQFKPKEDYLIKIDISLKHAELPPWLDRTLVFWNKDIVNSQSLELDYKVDNAPISR